MSSTYELIKNILDIQGKIKIGLVKAQFSDDKIEKHFLNFNDKIIEKNFLLVSYSIIFLNAMKFICEVQTLGFIINILLSILVCCVDFCLKLLSIYYIRKKDYNLNYTINKITYFRFVMMFLNYIFTLFIFFFSNKESVKYSFTKLVYLVIVIKSLSYIFIIPENFYYALILNLVTLLVFLFFIFYSNFNYNQNSLEINEIQFLKKVSSESIEYFNQTSFNSLSKKSSLLRKSIRSLTKNLDENNNLFFFKNTISYFEILIEILFFILSILIKKLINFTSRSSYLEKYKFKKFLNYCDQLVSGLNGFYISYLNKEIIFINKNLRTLLKVNEKILLSDVEWPLNITNKSKENIQKYVYESTNKNLIKNNTNKELFDENHHLTFQIANFPSSDYSYNYKDSYSDRIDAKNRRSTIIDERIKLCLDLFSRKLYSCKNENKTLYDKLESLKNDKEKIISKNIPRENIKHDSNSYNNFNINFKSDSDKGNLCYRNNEKNKSSGLSQNNANNKPTRSLTKINEIFDNSNLPEFYNEFKKFKSRSHHSDKNLMDPLNKLIEKPNIEDYPRNFNRNTMKPLKNLNRNIFNNSYSKHLSLNNINQSNNLHFKKRKSLAIKSINIPIFLNNLEKDKFKKSKTIRSISNNNLITEINDKPKNLMNNITINSNNPRDLINKNLLNLNRFSKNYNCNNLNSSRNSFNRMIYFTDEENKNDFKSINSNILSKISNKSNKMTNFEKENSDINNNLMMNSNSESNLINIENIIIESNNFNSQYNIGLIDSGKIKENKIEKNLSNELGQNYLNSKATEKIGKYYKNNLTFKKNKNEMRNTLNSYQTEQKNIDTCTNLLIEKSGNKYNSTNFNLLGVEKYQGENILSNLNNCRKNLINQKYNEKSNPNPNIKNHIKDIKDFNPENNQLLNKNKISENRIENRIKKQSREKNFILIGQYYIEINGERKYFLVYYRKINNILDILFYDYTKIKLAETISSENKLKHKLLSKIAHEFKTPLNSIIGLVNNLKNTVFKNMRIEKDLNIIQSLSHYTIFLISDVIQYASNDNYSSNVAYSSSNTYLSGITNKLSDENFKFNTNSNLNNSFFNSTITKKNKTNINIFLRQVDIKKSLFFCYDILNALLSCNEIKKKSIFTELLVDERINLVSLISDEIRINQILINFISNSIKFTKHGKILLLAMLVEKNNIKSYNKNILNPISSLNYFLKISVVDSGIGISYENQKNLFNDKMIINTKHEFNHQGSGLGLSICLNLIKLLNIRIEFSSKENLGSAFSLVLPVKLINDSGNSYNFNIMERFNHQNHSNFQLINQSERSTTRMSNLNNKCNFIHKYINKINSNKNINQVEYRRVNSEFINDEKSFSEYPRKIFNLQTLKNSTKSILSIDDSERYDKIDNLQIDETENNLEYFINSNRNKNPFKKFKRSFSDNKLNFDDVFYKRKSKLLKFLENNFTTSNNDNDYKQIYRKLLFKSNTKFDERMVSKISKFKNSNYKLNRKISTPVTQNEKNYFYNRQINSENIIKRFKTRNSVGKYPSHPNYKRNKKSDYYTNFINPSNFSPKEFLQPNFKKCKSIMDNESHKFNIKVLLADQDKNPTEINEIKNSNFKKNYSKKFFLTKTFNEEIDKSMGSTVNNEDLFINSFKHTNSFSHIKNNGPYLNRKRKTDSFNNRFSMFNSANKLDKINSNRESAINFPLNLNSNSNRGSYYNNVLNKDMSSINNLNNIYPNKNTYNNIGNYSDKNFSLSPKNEVLKRNIIQNKKCNKINNKENESLLRFIPTRKISSSVQENTLPIVNNNFLINKFTKNKINQDLANESSIKNNLFLNDYNYLIKNNKHANSYLNNLKKEFSYINPLDDNRKNSYRAIQNTNINKNKTEIDANSINIKKTNNFQNINNLNLNTSNYNDKESIRFKPKSSNLEMIKYNSENFPLNKIYHNKNKNVSNRNNLNIQNTGINNIFDSNQIKGELKSTENSRYENYFKGIIINTFDYELINSIKLQNFEYKNINFLIYREDDNIYFNSMKSNTFYSNTVNNTLTNTLLGFNSPNVDNMINSYNSNYNTNFLKSKNYDKNSNNYNDQVEKNINHVLKSGNTFESNDEDFMLINNFSKSMSNSINYLNLDSKNLKSKELRSPTGIENYNHMYDPSKISNRSRFSRFEDFDEINNIDETTITKKIDDLVLMFKYPEIFKTYSKTNRDFSPKSFDTRNFTNNKFSKKYHAKFLKKKNYLGKLNNETNPILPNNSNQIKFTNIDKNIVKINTTKNPDITFKNDKLNLQGTEIQNTFLYNLKDHIDKNFYKGDYNLNYSINSDISQTDKNIKIIDFNKNENRIDYKNKAVNNSGFNINLKKFSSCHNYNTNQQQNTGYDINLNKSSSNNINHKSLFKERKNKDELFNNENFQSTSNNKLCEYENLSNRSRFERLDRNYNINYFNKIKLNNKISNYDFDLNNNIKSQNQYNKFQVHKKSKNKINLLNLEKENNNELIQFSFNEENSRFVSHLKDTINSQKLKKLDVIKNETINTTPKSENLNYLKLKHFEENDIADENKIFIYVNNKFKPQSLIIEKPCGLSFIISNQGKVDKKNEKNKDNQIIKKNSISFIEKSDSSEKKIDLLKLYSYKKKQFEIVLKGNLNKKYTNKVSIKSNETIKDNELNSNHLDKENLFKMESRYQTSPQKKKDLYRNNDKRKISSNNNAYQNKRILSPNKKKIGENNINSGKANLEKEENIKINSNKQLFKLRNNSELSGEKDIKNENKIKNVKSKENLNNKKNNKKDNLKTIDIKDSLDSHGYNSSSSDSISYSIEKSIKENISPKKIDERGKKCSKVNNINIYSNVTCCLNNKKEKSEEFDLNSNKNVILVIEDNLHIRKSIANLINTTIVNLRKTHKFTNEFEIIEGGDGIDALKYVIDAKIGSRIKAIFIDENMEYLNGSEAVKHIRKFQNMNKINKFFIASVTSFEDNITKQNILNAGVNEIYQKPLNKSNLEEFFQKFQLFIG